MSHASGVAANARGADSTALAGEGFEVIVPTVMAPGAGKAVGKDATFEVFAKRLSDVGLGGVMFAPSVELAGAGALIPSLEVLGYCITHLNTVLTDEQAFDVAAYVNSQPRPVKANLEVDFPALQKKPVNAAFSPYTPEFSAEQHKYGPWPPIKAARHKSVLPPT